MRTVLKLCMVVIVLLMAGCACEQDHSVAARFSWTLPTVPIKFAVDSNGQWGVSIDNRLVIPLGEFAIGGYTKTQKRQPNDWLFTIKRGAEEIKIALDRRITLDIPNDLQNETTLKIDPSRKEILLTIPNPIDLDRLTEKISIRYSAFQHDVLALVEYSKENFKSIQGAYDRTRYGRRYYRCTYRPESNLEIFANLRYSSEEEAWILPARIALESKRPATAKYYNALKELESALYNHEEAWVKYIDRQEGQEKSTAFANMGGSQVIWLTLKEFRVDQNSAHQLPKDPYRVGVIFMNMTNL